MKQSLIIAVFIGAISASGIKQYSAGYTLPEANICVNTNKATAEDEPCSTNGNSAWNTITSARTGKPANAMAAPYPAHTEHLQLLQEGYTLPETNICVNTNKATAEDESCSTPGNSAWNTITSSRTGKPANAMAAPYPAHTEHIQLGLEGYTLPDTNICVNTNKATTEDEPCSTPGNSAWNTITSSRTGKPSKAMEAPYPGHAEHVQLEAAPETNHCTNTNKATTVDEACSTDGNSAWNTHTSSRTGDPTKAMADPYPGHTLH
jgi:hypothetical protein